MGHTQKHYSSVTCRQQILCSISERYYCKLSFKSLSKFCKYKTHNVPFHIVVYSGKFSACHMNCFYRICCFRAIPLTVFLNGLVNLIWKSGSRLLSVVSARLKFVAVLLYILMPFMTTVLSMAVFDVLGWIKRMRSFTVRWREWYGSKFISKILQTVFGAMVL